MKAVQDQFWRLNASYKDSRTNLLEGGENDREPWACERQEEKHTWCDPPQGSLGHDLHGHELSRGGLGTEIGSDWKFKCARKGAERNSHIKGPTFKSNVPKDPLQDVGGPMTRARAKAMKQALNCLIQDLQEIEPMLLSQISSHKGPRGIVLLLEAQHEVSKGPHGVQLGELT